MALMHNPLEPREAFAGDILFRLLGAACLMALPALWLALHFASLEAQLMGMGLSLFLTGAGGLWFFGKR